MKNLIVLMVLLISITLKSYGQEQGDAVVGVYSGFSFTGAAFKLAKTVAENDSTTSGIISGSNLPVFGLSFDYTASSKFTIGAFGSIQHFSAKVNEQSFEAIDTSFIITPITANLNRLYLGIVPKYQYETASNIELYSAIRVGFIFWQGNFDAENSNIDAIKGFGGGRPALSLVAIGGRYYFNPSMALHFEVATGAPALLTLGLNYKL